MSATTQQLTIAESVPVDQFKTPPRTRLKHKARKAHRGRYWEQHDKDSYVCPMCDVEKNYYEVHHIDGDWLNGHYVNLVGICYPCHKMAHTLPQRKQALDSWKAQFEKLGGGEQ